MGKYPPNTKAGGAWPRWAWICIGLTVTALVVCLGVLWAAYTRQIRLPESVQEKVDLLPDTAAREGTPSADQVTSPIEDNNFRIVINQMLTMETGTSPCNILAENPEENPYDLRVCLYLKDTGELLGATHIIQRGKRVDNIKLDQELDAGEYAVVANLEMFDDAQNKVNQLALDLSLLVRS